MYLVFLLIPAVVFLGLLIYALRRKIDPSLSADANKKSYPFRWIAVGSVITFLPIPIAYFLIFFGYNPYIIRYPFFFTLVLQAVGAFLMMSGFICAYKKYKNECVDKSGFIVAIIATFIGCVLNLYYAYENRLGFNSVVNCMFVFAILTCVMAVASFLLSKYFTRFRAMGIALCVLAVNMFIVYIEWNAEQNSGCLSTTWGALHFWTIPGMVFPIVLGAVAIFGCRLSGAVLRVPVVAKAVETIEYKPVEPMQHVANNNADGDILEKLKGYDDARLRKIVDNPKFHSAAVVDKARELLARREAWEQIKDLPDEELLEMTMADKGLYEPNIVEAASMELYQRDSRLLREQFMALTPDTLSAIASGTAPAPEGIRLAAQKYLSKSTRP